MANEQMTTWAIPDNTYVRLGEQASEIYPFAAAGARGWIRKHTQDLDGFVYVWIEWDSEDWRVAEQPDGWYFETHYEPLEEHDMDDATRKALAETAQTLANLAAQEPASGAPTVQSDDALASEYHTQLKKATEAAEAADGFILIAVERKTGPDVPSEAKLYRPTTVIAEKDANARAMLGLVASGVAHTLHEEAVTRVVLGEDGS